jgi:hypothetical protein
MTFRILAALGLAFASAGAAHAQASTQPATRAAPETRIVLTGSRIRTETRSARFDVTDTVSLDPVLIASPVVDLAPSVPVSIRSPNANVEMAIERDREGRVSGLAIKPAARPSSSSSQDGLARADSVAMAVFRAQMRAAGVEQVLRAVLDLLPLFESTPERDAQHHHEFTIVADEPGFRLRVRQQHVAVRLADSITSGGRAVVRVRDSVRYWMVRDARVADFPSSVTNRRVDSVSGRSVGQRSWSVDDSLRQTFCTDSRLTGPARRSTASAAGLRVTVSEHATVCARWIPESQYRDERRVADSLRVATMRTAQPALVQRAFANAPGLRDSLMRAFGAQQPTRVRDLLKRALGALPSDSPPVRELHRLALQAGDTGWVVNDLLAGSYNRADVKVRDASWALISRFLDSEEYAFRRGVDRASVAGALLTAAVNQPPTFGMASESAFCSPRACESMARGYQAGLTTPRAVIGLAARLAREPSVWFDSVRAYARRENAVDLLASLEGTMARSYQRTSGAMPAPDAEWHAWLRWAFAIDTIVPPSINGIAGRPYVTDIFDPEMGDFYASTGTTALRWASARTGFALHDVFSRRLNAASSDSEQVVFTQLLLRLGTLRDSVERVAQFMRSTDRVERFRGLSQLSRLVHESGPIIDDTVRAIVQRHVIDGILQNIARERRSADSAGTRRMAHAVSLADLSPTVRVRLAAAGVAVVPPRFREREDQEISITSIQIAQRGPLFFVSESYGTRVHRDDGRWMTVDSGTTYILLRTEAGFILFRQSSWIA